MSKIAVITNGGKQYKVREGEVVKVEKVIGEVGGKVSFEAMLKAADDKGTSLELGQPILKSGVEAEIVEQGRDKKVTVVKFKNKTRYKRTKGHKQSYSKVKITKI